MSAGRARDRAFARGAITSGTVGGGAIAGRPPR